MRYGLHLHTTAHLDDAKRYIDEVRPEMVKCLAGALTDDLVSFCHHRGVMVVGRLYVQNQSLSGTNQQAFLDQLEMLITRFPQVAVWEGFNEEHQTAGKLPARALFDISLMKLCERHWVKAAIGSFSTGQPEEGTPFDYTTGVWDEYMPALERAVQHGHFVALHEYSGPVMQYGAGENQWNGGNWNLSDPCRRGTELGWWTLRYRRHVAAWRALGLSRVPRILITEAGVDDIQPRPGPQGKGWRDYRGTEWERRPTFGDYVDQWDWFLWELEQDGIVAAVCGFGFGTLHHSSPGIAQWGGFDMRELLERFIDVMRQRPRGATQEPPMDDLAQALRAEFGNDFIDLRGQLRVANPGWQRDLDEVEAIAWHHTATDTTWHAVADFHVSKWGLSIGYPLGITGGRVYLLHDVDRVTPCVGAENRAALCVAVMGDFTARRPSAIELDRAHRLVAVLRKHLGRDVPVRPHNDYKGTECPGTWDEYVDQLNGAARPPDYRKVAWGTEKAARILQSEGLHAEHDFIVEHYVSDAIRRRDS